jgi:hypothetical protein
MTKKYLKHLVSFSALNNHDHIIQENPFTFLALRATPATRNFPVGPLRHWAASTSAKSPSGAGHCIHLSMIGMMGKIL